MCLVDDAQILNMSPNMKIVSLGQFSFTTTCVPARCPEKVGANVMLYDADTNH